VDIDSLAYLQSAPGQQLLAAVSASYDGSAGSALRLATGLRSHHAPDHIAAALTQVSLRRRAATKFGDDARRMYFTATGLEQATHTTVASHRAVRIASTGARSVLDLGCGVGGDLVTAAHAGLRVRGVERDEVTARIAHANIAALGLTGEVVVGNAEGHPRDGFDLVYADPSRRGAAGRIFDPDLYSPPWSFVDELLTGEAAIKLAPGIPHESVPAGVEAEWVSLDGQLREAVLWSGRAAVRDRRASVLRSAGDPGELTDADDPGTAEVQAAGRYVHEPDDAVIRAHLVTAYASRVRGWLLDPHLAYVSSDVLVSSRLGKAYRVVDVLPFREKSLRAALRARDIGTLTIKKRGIDVTPESLRTRLRLRGSQQATLILSRTPGSAVALLVEPLPHECDSSGPGRGV